MNENFTIVCTLINLYLYKNYYQFFKGNRLCDEGVNIVECYSDPCSTTHCPNFENALCIPNHCGECSAHYYNTSGHDITMMCSKYHIAGGAKFWRIAKFR